MTRAIMTLLSRADDDDVADLAREGGWSVGLVMLQRAQTVFSHLGKRSERYIVCWRVMRFRLHRRHLQIVHKRI